MKVNKLFLYLSSIFVLANSALAARSTTSSMVYGALDDFLIKWPAGNPVMFIKLLVWVLLFTLIYYGSSIAMKDAENRIRSVISFALSALAAFFIPNETLVGIANTYSFLGGLIFVAAPSAGLIYFVHKRLQEKSRATYAIKAAVYLGVSYIFLAFVNSFYDSGSSIWVENLLNVVETASAVFAILSLVNCFNAVFHGGGPAFGKITSKALKMGSKLGDSPGDEKRAEKDLRLEKREVRGEKRDIRQMENMEKREFKFAKDAVKRLKIIKEDIANDPNYNHKLPEVKKEINILNKDINRLQGIEVQMINKQDEFSHMQQKLMNTQRRLSVHSQGSQDKKILGLENQLRRDIRVINGLIKIINSEIEFTKNLCKRIRLACNEFVSHLKRGNKNEAIHSINQAIGELLRLEKIDELMRKREQDIIRMDKRIRKIDRYIQSRT